MRFLILQSFATRDVTNVLRLPSLLRETLNRLAAERLHHIFNSVNSRGDPKSIWIHAALIASLLRQILLSKLKMLSARAAWELLADDKTSAPRASLATLTVPGGEVIAGRLGALARPNPTEVLASTTNWYSVAGRRFVSVCTTEVDRVFCSKGLNFLFAPTPVRTETL
jgi:hypothetical protein